MKISFNKTATNNLKKAAELEWLEANGLGGWASSTIIGANTRRYHGVLIAATKPPVGRVVLLSKLDETINLHGKRFELQCNFYPGTIHPHGYDYLEKFEKDLFPIFEYNTESVRLRKTFAAINGENTTVIIYEVLAAISSFSMELQPLVAARYYHSLTQANDAIHRDAKFKGGILRVQAYDGFEELFIDLPNASFEPNPEWFYNFEYPMEQQQGSDFREDLFSYGHFKINLNLGDKIGVIISTQDTSGKDAFQLFEMEKQRRLDLQKKLPIKNSITKTLALAADQFIVNKGEKYRTIIAGYPWFADPGRDTMVALTGLTLVTGRFDEAKRILQSFSKYINKGMLPDDFPDIEDEPEYNSVDTTLWFFIAIYKYLHYAKDEEFVKGMMPLLKEIIEWYMKGTRFNIHSDKDGFLVANEPGFQLTWMDSKVGDKSVIPRYGKIVEINALWYNALMIYAELLSKFETDKAANEIERKADGVKRKFLEIFWNEEFGYLYDFVIGQEKDRSIRPNQIFALSLPYPLVSGEKARKVFQTIVTKLFTPYGLRSLSQEDHNYRGQYIGDSTQQAIAFHQGTVWGWLLGPFITAMVRFYGDHGKERAKTIVENFTQHFSAAGIGTISEIFDGDQPHTPRGCFAKAWSVGEILRAYVEDVVGLKKK